MATVLVRLLAAAALLRCRAAASCCVLLLLCVAGPAAQAASYTFRSDTYSWETTTNTISTWDKTCTSYQIDDDKVTLSFTGGFTFPFAGSSYSSVRVLTNGMLQFGTDNGFHRTYTNTTLPAAAPSNIGGGCAASTPTNVLMGYWMDLKPSPASGGGGTVTWQQKGTAPNRYFVVSWNAVYQYNTSTPYTFQIILYENGEFKYQYGNANASGSNATIGVQVNSTDYTLYSYNSGYNANGTAIRWLPASGTPSRVAEYRMDEYSWSGAVGEVIDSSGNGHNGVRVGSSSQTTASGYVCRAFEVPSNTNTTIAAVDSALDVDSAIGSKGSISLWYRASVAWSNNSNAAMLVDASTSSSRPFFLQRDDRGALRFVVSDSAGNTVTASSPAQTFAAGTWVHIAATWFLASGSNQSTLRIYVNGVQVEVQVGTTNGSLDPSLATLFIGDNRSSSTPTGATDNSANGRIDEVRIYNYEITAVELAADIAVSHSCAPALHHVEIQADSSSGLTCNPVTLTLVACQDAACATRSTSGVTGTLTASGTGVSWNFPDGTAFTIPSGSSTATLRLHATDVTAPGNSVTLGTSGVSPTPTSGGTCNFAGATDCKYAAYNSGFVFDVPHHAAETAQTVNISAIKKDDATQACVPAFANVSRSLTFTCSYTNPSSGFVPVRVGGRALNSGNNAAAACDGTGQAVSLAFNAGGVASTTVQYADAGKLSLTARYTGTGSEAGLSMSHTDDFVAAPGNFLITGPSGVQVAGVAFNVAVTARNSANATTRNFGRESQPDGATVTHTLYQPVGGAVGSLAAVNVSSPLGSFTNGAASGQFTWSEAGLIDLVANLTARPGVNGYLDSGLGITGNTGGTGAVGRFIPHHYNTVVTPACSTGSTPFTYYDQPFVLQVTAMNGLASPGVTSNYAGDRFITVSGASRTVARDTALTDANGLGGSFSPATVTAASFSNGSATLSTARYGGFTTKLVNPGSLKARARATDASANDVSSTPATSPSASEGTMVMRSGRLRLFNAFGSERSTLAVSLQAEYWSGTSWLLNGDDQCSNVSLGAVALSNYRDGKGAAGAWTTAVAAGGGLLSGGRGTLTLSAPVPAGRTGIVDLALNLGSGTSDQSCMSVHPATTGANLSWLRSQNGACSATWDRDPSARASFGIYTPQSTRTIHAREIY